MYPRTTWKNDVWNPANRRRMTEVENGVYDVERVGTHMEVGTPQDKDHFNNMEHGISDNAAAIAVMLNMVRQLQWDTGVEKKTVTLTNTDSYPFNNSTQTVALAELRNNLDYSVEAEVLSKTGPVLEVKVYDKQLNGFKVKFEGSGNSAVVRLKITGGLV